MKRFWLVILCMFLLMLPTTSGSISVTATEQRDDPVLSFVVMSDTHVTDSNPVAVDKFTRLLRDIRQENPDFYVINGDLTEGSPQDYQTLLAIFKRHAYSPLYGAIGNHDYYYQWQNKEWDDEREQELFRNAFGLERLYYDRFENGVHLIFLAPEQYMEKRTELGEGAWLSDDQLKWFEETLMKSKAPTFVFLHQHLDNTVFKEDQRVSVMQTEQLKQIARKHPQVIWFSGHSHISAEWPTEIVKQDGVLYVGTSTVYRPIDVSEKMLPGYEARANLFIKDNPDKSQSRFVDVYPDRIVIRTRNHHITDWAPGQHVEKLKTPLATQEHNVGARP